jgi:hypothetical protein
MDIQSCKGIIRAAANADDTVILEGPHGVGKSDIAKQIEQEDGYHMETLFLSHQEVGDLIGTPHTIMDGETAITTWSVPIWLQRMNIAAKGGKKCMLFLDELNRAPLDVRQSAMQLVLERQIHEHTLPTVDGFRCLVIAAINPADDYQVDELDPALMDRFLHAEVEADAQVWLDWARQNNVNQIVRDFIAEHPDRIHWTPADGGTGATPRSWTKLGSHMDNIKTIPAEITFQVMKGKIGKELASQFYTFFQNYVDVVKMADIEAIVAKNKDKYKKIEDLAALITKKIKKQEAIQKSELAQQFKDKYVKEGDMLPMLAYLYALEIEICVAFLKGFRKDDADGYKKLVDIDTKLNDKKLFKRIVQAADRTD